MSDSRDRLPELDWLKGFAIVSVVCIHAKLYADTDVFNGVMNRAVPIFLVLFGITSELWWERSPAGSPAEARRSIAKWYRSRYRRLYVPYWFLALAWWCAAWKTGTLARLRLDAGDALLTALGCSPWIGTSWFVTLILMLVLLYPALRLTLTRGWAPFTLLLSAAACAASIYYLWNIVVAGKELFGGKVPEPGWYYDWIFPPRSFWDVLSGAFVARRWRGRISQRVTIIAVLITIAGWVLAHVARGDPGDIFLGPLREQAVTYLNDVPLAIALLGIFRWLALPSVARRALAWLGKSSWGIYMGHLLVHEVVHMAGRAPETEDELVRGVYALVLLGSGSSLTVLGSALEDRVARALAPRSSNAVEAAKSAAPDDPGRPL